MNKAQITIFIVLGIVILIIFGLVFFVTRQTSGVVLEKKINKIYADFLSSTDIKHIIQNCLSETTNEALFLVGIQGGRIYDYQVEKGYNISSFYDVVPFNYTLGIMNENGTIYNVSYGIKAPISSAPDYPYSGSLLEDVSSVFSTPFPAPGNQVLASVTNPGKFTILAELCNKLGPNDPYIEGAGITCETYSTKNESLQEYIKLYVEQNVEDCINFTLKQTLKYNISSGNLSTKVLIGERDLLVSLTYPIEISMKNKPPITKYLDFNIKPKIRLKILHEIASHLIGHNPYVIPTQAEANNIFFNIEKDDPNDCYGGKSSCIIEGINISRLKNYCLNHNCNFDDRHYNYSDILVIEDNKSIIDGRPYRFQFVIENRRPALDFIDESVGPDKYYYWYINATYTTIPQGVKNLTEIYSNIDDHPSSLAYNIILGVPGTLLEIFPLGIDPDEDNLTYNYSVIQSSSTDPWNKDTFQDSTHYKEGFLDRNYVSGFVSDHFIAKDAIVNPVGGWGGEPLYYDNIIIVNVSDDEGLYDYQNVTIRYKKE